MAKTYNLGDVSAYAIAKSHGYSGTEAQFAQEMTGAAESARAAAQDASDAEAYAIGKRDGVDVTSTDPAYQNNAKYYANTASGANVANAFSTSTAYAVGDYVLYNGTMYKFTAAHPAGAWNASHATAVKAMDEVSALEDDLTQLEEVVEALEPGLSDVAKEALLACFAHTAWIDEYGQDYYDELYYALYPETIEWDVDWDYTKGDPRSEENGFTVTSSGSPTITMEHDGLYIGGTSDSTLVPPGNPLTAAKGTIECEFTLIKMSNSFTGDTWIISNGSNGARFNLFDGALHSNPTANNAAEYCTPAISGLEEGRKYKLWIKWDTNGATLKINGVGQYIESRQLGSTNTRILFIHTQKLIGEERTAIKLHSFRMLEEDN